MMQASSEGAMLLLLLLVPACLSQNTVKGFDFLDSFTEDRFARENIVEIERPFSMQLSVCIWINPTWPGRPSKLCLIDIDKFYYQ